MKQNNGIVNNLDSILDLPISEEMIGAYIEGNLNEIERDQFKEALEKDMILSSLVDEVIPPC